MCVCVLECVCGLQSTDLKKLFLFFPSHEQVCRDCIALTHTGHLCVALSEAAKEARTELSDVSRQALQRVQQITAAQAEVVKVAEELEARYKTEDSKCQQAYLMVKKKKEGKKRGCNINAYIFVWRFWAKVFAYVCLPVCA